MSRVACPAPKPAGTRRERRLSRFRQEGAARVALGRERVTGTTATRRWRWEDRDLMFNSNSVGQRVDPKTWSGLVVVRKPDGVGSCRVCARRTLDVYYAFYLSSFANRIRKAPRGRILCGKSDFIETEGPTTNFIALRSHQHERQSALSARSPI